MTFGKWLEKTRKAKSWSTYDLAKISGYSASHVRDIEKDNSSPGLFTASTFAQALGYKLWEVLKIVEEENTANLPEFDDG